MTPKKKLSITPEIQALTESLAGEFDEKAMLRLEVVTRSLPYRTLASRLLIDIPDAKLVIDNLGEDRPHDDDDGGDSGDDEKKGRKE